MRPVDVVLDIGANTGQFGWLLRQRVGWRGPIVSFEPIPNTFAALVERIRGDPKWTGEQLAVASEAGTLTLNLWEQSPDLTSRLPPSGRHLDRLPALAQQPTATAVQAVTLESYLAGSDFASATSVFLKIDVQGMDLDVLRSGGTYLERTTLLQLEVPFSPIYENQPSAAELLNAAKQLGFSLAALLPVAFASDGVSVLDADAFFVRS